MAAALRKGKSLFSTTLSTSIGTGTGETITLASATGLPTDTPITITIDRVDSNGNATPSTMERITGTISGTSLTSYTRGVDGSTEQAHSSGAVIEYIWNAADWNDHIDSLLVGHNSDGTHDPAILYDTNGNEEIKFTTTASAVNELTVTNAATGNSPSITATGGDTNVDVKIAGKGTGHLQAYDNYTAGYFDVVPNSSMARQSLNNGNFDVWQRGTSVALADVTTTFQADRWSDYLNKNGGTLPTLTRSRVALTPGTLSNAFYGTRLTTNGAGTSLGVSSFHEFFQRIEHGTRFLCGNGKKVTVSFWAKSDIANKKIGISLAQTYGTGGSPTSAETISGTSFTLTSTLTKYTHTFTTNTLAGKTFGTSNDDYLEVDFWYMWGDTIGDSFGLTGAETYVGSGFTDIAQVQLCAGEVDLPFQPKSFEDELRACQRYYEKSYSYASAPGTAEVTGQAAIKTQYTESYHMMPTIQFKTRKRTSTPTITLYSPGTGTAAKIRTTAPADVDGTAAGYIGETGFNPYVNNSSIAAGVGLTVHWTAENEL